MFSNIQELYGIFKRIENFFGKPTSSAFYGALALPPLAAEPIFHIGNFTVTNTYINSTLTVVGFVLFAYFLNRSIKKHARPGQSGAPRGLHNFFESILELILKYVDQVTGSRKKSLRFLPIVGSLFLFILISNWMGSLPGVGSVGLFKVTSAGKEFIPLFRPADSDLNMTLSMAVLAVILSHIFGIVVIGFFKYANRFIKLGDLYQAVKSLKPVEILTAFVEFFVGFIELFSELAKIVSLSLRLFGNVFAGEVLLTVIGALLAFLAPLPFIALELLVGFIQALIFAMLALVYLTVATSETHEKAEIEEEVVVEEQIPTP